MVIFPSTTVLRRLNPEETMVRASTACTAVSRGQHPGLTTPPFFAAGEERRSQTSPARACADLSDLRGTEDRVEHVLSIAAGTVRRSVPHETRDELIDLCDTAARSPRLRTAARWSGSESKCGRHRVKVILNANSCMAPATAAI